MEIIKIPVGYLEANCYIVFDEKTKGAVIIDPGDEAEKILSVIEKEKLKPLAIINTHNHFDHTGANNEIKRKFNVKIYRPAKDEETKKFGTLPAVKFLLTPGHSRDGLCVLTEGHLFSGDTLFASSVGRTDLAGGDFNQLTNSIKTKILTLLDNTIVHPGHGPDTTIKAEKKSNPFLK
ncbi:MAG TPA: MBL fold metallo-hydrolase [Elusimicrobia bacterium]|nr:MBL fold metallo-hydrolase [Elusimicrobiota bacterium]